MAKEAKEGIIEAYIHQNKKIGVLVDLRCQTDFVARTEEFKKLAHELCLQIAAMNPLFLNEKDIPEKFLTEKRKILREELESSGRQKKMVPEISSRAQPNLKGLTVDEIVEGKLKKYKEEISLLSQPWIRDETKKIQDLIEEYIAKLGEKIIIKRFVRFEI